MGLHTENVIWLTGLPASGKTTLAYALKYRLGCIGKNAVVLDGDEMRTIFHMVGYTKRDRDLHVRRMGELATAIARQGTTAICAFVSPYRVARQYVRSIDRIFIEVFVDCPIEVCISRDPKGLYNKAKAGEITGFTGVDDPYEPPEKPEVHIKTNESDVESCIEAILRKIR